MAADSQVSQGSRVILLAMNPDPRTSRTAVGLCGVPQKLLHAYGLAHLCFKAGGQDSVVYMRRCPRYYRASQMALGVNLWATKTSLEEGIYLPL